MKTTKTDSTASTIGCLALFAVLPFSLAWRGYVSSVLWAWFIIPTFHLPPLTIPVAIGLACFLSLIHPTSVNSNDEDDDAITKAVKSIMLAFLHPLFALIFGWLVYSFTGGAK